MFHIEWLIDPFHMKFIDTEAGVCDKVYLCFMRIFDELDRAFFFFIKQARHLRGDIDVKYSAFALFA